MKKLYVLLTALAISIGLSAYVGAQQGGSGLPGGSNYSTQIRLNSTAFGGVGPGNSGEVLTSNGAGMAPTFQAGGGGGCAPAGTTGDVLLDDGAGGCSELAAGTSGQVLTSAGAGMDPTWETYSASGSFVVSFEDACTTTPTITMDWTREGNLVNIEIDSTSGFPCTGDSTSFLTTATPVPAAIRPTTTAGAVVSPFFSGFQDNGASTVGCMQFLNGGSVRILRSATFGAACSSGGWTASGNRNATISGTSSTYSILEP